MRHGLRSSGAASNYGYATKELGPLVTGPYVNVDTRSDLVEPVQVPELRCLGNLRDAGKAMPQGPLAHVLAAATSHHTPDGALAK
jgi:hypothetical protein